MSKCDCYLCQLSDRIRFAVSERDPDKLIELVKELYTAYESVGLELKGEWPTDEC